MPKRKARKSSPETTDAALLLVAHRRSRGGRGKFQPGATEAARLLGKRRRASMTDEEHRAMSAKGGSSYWNSMTPVERQIELKRRAAVRKQNRLARMRKKLGKR